METTCHNVAFKFERVERPLHPALTVIGQIVDGAGARVWAGWGSPDDMAGLYTKAAEWLDDCHGRAGHTPLLPVIGDEAGREPWHDIQAAVNARQSADLGTRQPGPFYVQRLDLDGVVTAEKMVDTKDHAEECAEVLFQHGHPSRVLDSNRNTVCEFEL